MKIDCTDCEDFRVSQSIIDGKRLIFLVVDGESILVTDGPFKQIKKLVNDYRPEENKQRINHAG